MNNQAYSNNIARRIQELNEAFNVQKRIIYFLIFASFAYVFATLIIRFSDFGLLFTVPLGLLCVYEGFWMLTAIFRSGLSAAAAAVRILHFLCIVFIAAPSYTLFGYYAITSSNPFFGSIGLTFLAVVLYALFLPVITFEKNQISKKITSSFY